MDPIHVGTAVTATLDITRLLQVAQHPIGMALRDTGSRRNVRDPQVGLLSNSKQNLGVSRDEGPAPSERRLYLTGLTCLCHFCSAPTLPRCFSYQDVRPLPPLPGADNAASPPQDPSSDPGA